MPQSDQLFGQPVHHPLPISIEFRWNGFRQRSDLRDAHLTFLLFLLLWEPCPIARQAFALLDPGTFGPERSSSTGPGPSLRSADAVTFSTTPISQDRCARKAREEKSGMVLDRRSPCASDRPGCSRVPERP